MDEGAAQGELNIAGSAVQRVLVCSHPSLRSATRYPTGSHLGATNGSCLTFEWARQCDHGRG